MTLMISRIFILIGFLFFNSNLSLIYAQSADAVKLSVSSRDAELREVLRRIAMQHGVSLAVLGTVTGNVTIYLDDVPLEDGLAALLEPLGFTYENRGGIYCIRREIPETQRVTLTVTDSRLTVSANNADVHQVIRTPIDAQAGVSITAGPNLVGPVTAHITDKPVDDAIAALFSGENFVLN